MTSMLLALSVSVALAVSESCVWEGLSDAVREGVFVAEAEADVPEELLSSRSSASKVPQFS